MLQYGDITPAVAAYSVVRMLKRAMPFLQIEKFGQVYVLPTNSTQTAKFRRYFLSGATGSAGSGSGSYFYPVATTPLLEGVTPAGNTISNQDYTAQLSQYGDWVPLTDVVNDTHPDDILTNLVDILGESAAITFETLRFNVLKAGTNVFYANAVAGRSTVAAAISVADERRVTTALNGQNAKKITSVIGSTPDYNTKSVEAAYMAICHPDLDSDLRTLANFKPVADYGPHTSPMEGEIGSHEQVRYLSSTVFAPFLGTGVVTATSPTLRHSDAGTGDKVNVYPILYFARDAFGIVPLKGKSSLTPMVVNPKPAPGDPLGQRGSVGWKAWTTTIILQEAFLGRLEVGCTA
jgi:N4-gp56 family major capsid protein